MTKPVRNLYSTDRFCCDCGNLTDTKEYTEHFGYCNDCMPMIDDVECLLGGRANYYHNILKDVKIAELECKHIMFETLENSAVIDDDIAANHRNIQWGVARSGTVETERLHIQRMLDVDLDKPVRITITDNNIWGDNTHTLISWIVRKGYDATVSEIPYYICDLRNGCYIIAGKWEHVYPDFDSCYGAAIRASRHVSLERNGGRINTHWTIGQLSRQLGY